MPLTPPPSLSDPLPKNLTKNSISKKKKKIVLRGTGTTVLYIT